MFLDTPAYSSLSLRVLGMDCTPKMALIPSVKDGRDIRNLSPCGHGGLALLGDVCITAGGVRSFRSCPGFSMALHDQYAGGDYWN